MPLVLPEFPEKIKHGGREEHVIICVSCACADFKEQMNIEIPLNYDVSVSQEHRLKTV